MQAQPPGLARRGQGRTERHAPEAAGRQTRTRAAADGSDLARPGGAGRQGGVRVPGPDGDAVGRGAWRTTVRDQHERCELGLGSVALVPLAEAREKAVANRKLAREGGDPLAEKRRLQSVPTFAEATAAVVERKQAGWKNAEQVWAWRNSLRRYAFPRIGTRPVSEVESADVLAILSPIWHSKPTIAKAVRQRIHAVLEWAIAMNLRNDNPADRVRPVLGPQRNIVEHMRGAAAP